MPKIQHQGGAGVFPSPNAGAIALRNDRFGGMDMGIKSIAIEGFAFGPPPIGPSRIPGGTTFLQARSLKFEKIHILEVTFRIKTVSGQKVLPEIDTNRLNQRRR
jgi:hypothetical protein